MELISNLVSQLGVTEGQAKGGLGSILSFAKDSLGGQDFSKIADMIGGSHEIMNAAPKAEGATGMLGSVTSALGVGQKLGGLTALIGQFKSLGLDADMVQKFAPIVTSFLQKQGGDQVSGLLSKILK